MSAYTDNPTPDTLRVRGDYDAPHTTVVTPAEDIRSVLLNRVSWAAVSAGVVMTLAAQIVLNLLGIGAGIASSYTGAGTAAMPVLLSSGALIWWSVAGIIAACVGGFTAGRLSGEPYPFTAAWHGLTAWAASVLVIMVLAFAGAGVLMGNTISVAGVAGANIAPNILRDGAASAAANPAPDETVAPGIAAPNPPALASNLPSVDAKAVAHSALICAVALLLGAIAAWFCGMSGAVEPTITDRKMRRQHPLH